MAPTITSAEEYPKDHLSLAHKLRKPIVEKMRRDRINNSIEELKSLLGPQLLNQQSDSKLEKADILEMTVCLLKRQLQQKTLPSSDTAHQGFSRCAQEVVRFLSKDSGETLSHGKLLSQFQTLQMPIDAYRRESSQRQLGSPVQHFQSKDKSAPWRPW